MTATTTPTIKRRPDDTPAVARLRMLVVESADATYVTTGGVIRTKTAKRRQTEHAVAEEVVRFAFDHAGITGGFLAPTGLFWALLTGSPVDAPAIGPNEPA